MNKLQKLQKHSKKAYLFLDRYENLRQIIVYLFIGGTAAVLELFILFVLVSLLHIWYLVGATISFIIVVFYSYFSHKKFTFRHKGGRDRLRFILFLLSAITGLILSLLLLSIFVEVFKLWYFSAAVIIKFIILIWNFLMNKFVIFNIFKEKIEVEEYV